MVQVMVLFHLRSFLKLPSSICMWNAVSTGQDVEEFGEDNKPSVCRLLEIQYAMMQFHTQSIL